MARRIGSGAGDQRQQCRSGERQRNANLHPFLQIPGSGPGEPTGHEEAAAGAIGWQDVGR
jgi:hypothetical protein